jgi:hypothetical protein
LNEAFTYVNWLCKTDIINNKLKKTLMVVHNCTNVFEWYNSYFVSSSYYIYIYIYIYIFMCVCGVNVFIVRNIDIMFVSVFCVLYLTARTSDFHQVEIFCNFCLQDIFCRQFSAVFKINLSSWCTDWLLSWSIRTSPVLFLVT